MRQRAGYLLHCGDMWSTFRGLPQFWGLLGLEFQLVSFIMFKAHVPVDIMEELSPNMRMNPENNAKDAI
jgi:hypothetical protein